MVQLECIAFSTGAAGVYWFILWCSRGLLLYPVVQSGCIVLSCGAAGVYYFILECSPRVLLFPVVQPGCIALSCSAPGCIALPCGAAGQHCYLYIGFSFGKETEKIHTDIIKMRENRYRSASKNVTTLK